MRRFFGVLLVLVVLVSCASTSGQPVAASQGQRRAAGNPPLSDDLRQHCVDVYEVARSAWRCPKEFSSRKDLSVPVTLTIRKDGTVEKFVMDARSGNREFDKAVLTAVRSIGRVPAIPDSLNVDTIQIGLRFLPGVTGKEETKEQPRNR